MRQTRDGDFAVSVTALNEYVKALFDSDEALGAVQVRGELSNYKIYPSGHHYFTLKDQNSSLRCVFFKNGASKLRFRPEDGMGVLAYGRVSVFTRDGAYQLYVSALTPGGAGDLNAAYERLKAKLHAEGMFDASHKKPLPAYPETIAVITSPAGAAVRDIIRVLGARWPCARVLVLPARVQGAQAPEEIAAALDFANSRRVADLIITGRGGGAAEDLQAFNDERVARAIYRSAIPVISAVGHEPDVTISDLVADVRAATPSNAAELAAPDAADVAQIIDALWRRASAAHRRLLDAAAARLENLTRRRCLADPASYIEDKRRRLAAARDRLASAAEIGLHAGRERYARLASALDAMNPLKVLGRGYAIALTADGLVIRSAGDTAPGETITIRLRDDELPCYVADG